ncbi:hypothetical protein GGR50DRAFT_691543 [Xylaria sp. CBS 124048]|nr:hypothetical protein GGR50DRAFT_691543 [Xylaria sp. CBS 124048]
MPPPALVENTQTFTVKHQRRSTATSRLAPSESSIISSIVGHNEAATAALLAIRDQKIELNDITLEPFVAERPSRLECDVVQLKQSDCGKSSNPRPSPGPDNAILDGSPDSNIFVIQLRCVELSLTDSASAHNGFPEVLFWSPYRYFPLSTRYPKCILLHRDHLQHNSGAVGIVTRGLDNFCATNTASDILNVLSVSSRIRDDASLLAFNKAARLYVQQSTWPTLRRIDVDPYQCRPEYDAFLEAQRSARLTRDDAFLLAVNRDEGVDQPCGDEFEPPSHRAI